MEILEIRDTTYPDAHELLNKTGRPGAKHQKSPPGGNSVRKGANRAYLPRLTGRPLTDLQKADREQTAANKRVLWLINGKRRLVTMEEYLRLREMT